MSTYIITRDGELYHYGIKGMKWGRRRFQDKSGKLTAAGKKRYSDDDASSDKSKHRLNLEEKYRQQGMSKREAEIAANKRIKIEKAIAITAGITVAAASAYVINKNVKERTDRVIKSGTTLQRITRNPDESYDRAFYSSYKKGDNLKYRGMMGNNHFEGENVHKVTLNANDNIKVVSRRKAEDTFIDLYKNDPEFRNAFELSNRMYQQGNGNIHDKVTSNMSDKQLRKIGYDAFNSSLVNHTPVGETASKKFYNKLKEKGYDAVMDVNDQKYSGYKAKAPVIVFNNAGKISKSNVEKLSKSEMESDLAKVYGRMLVADMTKKTAVYGGATAAAVYANKTVNSIAVDNYKLQHPNTKLTDQEILKLVTQ